jgi:uncharacterized membrane protein YfcA
VATVLILLGVGLVMGAVNNLAGAAGGLGLIALEMAAGLDPTAANASLRLGAVTIGLSGWLGFKSRHRTVPARAWLYGAMTIPGAAAGAVMALTLPTWVLRVALLLTLVTVLLQQLRRLPVGPAGPGRRWTAPLLFALVGVHMGFIQVGTGLIAIAALTATHSRDLVEVNAAKMALVICSSITATAVLATSGEVVWVPSIALAAGCAAGSFAASRWSVDRGHGAVRAVVLGITVLILIWAVCDVFRVD